MSFEAIIFQGRFSQHLRGHSHTHLPGAVCRFTNVFHYPSLRLSAERLFLAFSLL